jgi:hypothetical protein
MRGWIARPALVVALLAVPLLAQRHGSSGGFSGHSGPVSGGSFMSHGSSMGRSSFGQSSMAHGPMINRGPSFSGSQRSNSSRFGNNFGSGRRVPFASSRRFNRSNRSRFFYGVSPWGFYGYPSYYGYPYYDTYDSSADAYPENNYAGGYDDQSGQMAQDKIDRLEDEVAELREQRSPARSSAVSKPEIRTSTVLVFQDKHTREVLNYAIVGETLWVFDAQKAAKLPVDSLDVPATIKANDDRGVDFRLPDQQ